MSQIIEHVESLQGTVKQIEIDQRMIFTLEEGSAHVKVWHEQDYRGPSASEVKMRRQPINELGCYELPAHRSEVLSLKVQ